MNKFFLSVSAIILSSSVLPAASITFRNISPSVDVLPVVDQSNTPIPAGAGFAAIGYFDTFSNAQITASISSLAAFDALKLDFQQFGNDIDFGGAGAFNTSGLFNQDIDSAILSGSDFINETIYAVIGNNDTLAGSTELLVLESTLSFLVDDPTFSATFDLSVDSFSTLFGEAGPSDIDVGAGPGASLRTVAPVPEPSTYAALAGLMALGFVMVRRRA